MDKNGRSLDEWKMFGEMPNKTNGNSTANGIFHEGANFIGANRSRINTVQSQLLNSHTDDERLTRLAFANMTINGGVRTGDITSPTNASNGVRNQQVGNLQFGSYASQDTGFNSNGHAPNVQIGSYGSEDIGFNSNGHAPNAQIGSNGSNNISLNYNGHVPNVEIGCYGSNGTGLNSNGHVPNVQIGSNGSNNISLNFNGHVPNVQIGSYGFQKPGLTSNEHGPNLGLSASVHDFPLHYPNTRDPRFKVPSPKILEEEEEQQQHRMHQQYMNRLELMHSGQGSGSSPMLMNHNPSQSRLVRTQRYGESNQQESRSINSAPIRSIGSNPNRGFHPMQSHGINLQPFGGHYVFNLQNDNFLIRYLNNNANVMRSTVPKFTIRADNTISDFVGWIYHLAKQQDGCRFLQEEISKENPDDCNMVFREVIHHIVELAKDKYGNYLVQKLLQVCNEDQYTRILDVITNPYVDLIGLSCDQYGTRFVQKIVKTLKTREQCSMFVSRLSHGVLTLVNDKHGNHVAHHCLLHFKPEFNQFVFQAAIRNCFTCGTNAYGCTVLQECLEHSTGERRSNLVHAVALNAPALSLDPFGNYVVQCVLKLKLEWATVAILENLQGHYCNLSCDRFASNVVETCIELTNDDVRVGIARELMRDHRFGEIAKNSFGNYVIQHALDYLKGQILNEFLDALMRIVRPIVKSHCGKKILDMNRERRRIAFGS